jgi:hypothetical protein
MRERWNSGIWGLLSQPEHNYMLELAGEDQMVEVLQTLPFGPTLSIPLTQPWFMALLFRLDFSKVDTSSRCSTAR